MIYLALASVAQRLSGLSTSLRTKGSPVRFPVRAHAWVAGQVPSRGRMRSNHTLMFLSLSPHLSLCLKIKLKKKKEMIYLTLTLTARHYHPHLTD